MSGRSGADAAGERVDGARERLGVRQQRRDVLEDDAGLGEVGHVADVGREVDHVVTSERVAARRGAGDAAQVAHEQRLGQLGAQTGELVELLEAGADAVGVGRAQLRREHLLDEAGLALDRRVDGAQVPGVEAVALQARRGGHDLHVLGTEAAGLGRDQPELLEAAHELLVDVRRR